MSTLHFANIPLYGGIATCKHFFMSITPIRFPRPWTSRKAGECAFPVFGEGEDVLSCCRPPPAGDYCAAHREDEGAAGARLRRHDARPHPVHRLSHGPPPQEPPPRLARRYRPPRDSEMRQPEREEPPIDPAHLALPVNAGVNVTRDLAGRIARARRQDVFDLMCARGKLTPSALTAVRRLQEDMAVLHRTISCGGDLTPRVDRSRRPESFGEARLAAGTRIEPRSPAPARSPPGCSWPWSSPKWSAADPSPGARSWRARRARPCPTPRGAVLGWPARTWRRLMGRAGRPRHRLRRDAARRHRAGTEQTASPTVGALPIDGQARVPLNLASASHGALWPRSPGPAGNGDVQPPSLGRHGRRQAGYRSELVATTKYVITSRAMEASDLNGTRLKPLKSAQA